MTTTNRLIENFRLLPGFLHTNHTLQGEGHPFSLLAGGLPRRSVVELSGPPGAGKTECLIQFLVENPALKVAWIEERFTLYPYQCNEAGLHRLLFIEAGNKDPLRIAHQVLRSQVFSLVALATEKKPSELALRRLQLATQRANATVVLITDHASKDRNWPIALQLRIDRPHNDLVLTILRRKACHRPL